MKQKKLRILINTNAPWATSGYSQQAAELLPLIHNEGYPLACIDFFGLVGGKITLDGILHYPIINHVYGSDAMVLHGRDFKADVVFALQDQWVLNPQDLQQVNRYIPITPIDHDPAPKNVLSNLRLAYRIVTYSKFGQDQLNKNGLYSTYIPHTVNTEIFEPMDKQERKKKAGLPTDCFLVGMVAANKDNPPRKSFQEALEAFKAFCTKEPKAMLYIHTNPEFPGGFRIDRYAEFLGIKNRVLFPDWYQMNFNTGKKEMALIYNTFDVLLAPSTSEGFCIPLIEAQACGVPVITNDFTSMTELVKPKETGFLTEVLLKRWNPNESYMAIPSANSIFNCLIDVHKADRLKMSEAARKFIVDNYDTNKIFKSHWIPYLQLLEKEIYPLETPKE